MSIFDPHQLLEFLIALPREAEWVEFKENYFDQEEVGRYISSLANSAMLKDETRAFLVFGVSDSKHEITGTTVRLKARKVGNEVFENWVSRLLNPRINIEFIALDVNGKHVEMISIDPGYISPVRFKNVAYIRIDSIQKPLHEYPERERTIWAKTSRFTFETGIAKSHLSPSEVMRIVDCEALLKGLSLRKSTTASVIEHLTMEGLLLNDLQGGYDATNLLVLLAAKDLRGYPQLARKAPRVIQYKGSSKLEATDDVTGQLGYGVSFTKLLRYIMGRVPHKEELLHGVRKTKYAIPELAVREIVANALIHQDLTSTGDGPVVEIFDDRIKVTNPGRPLIEPERFIDAPAKSRNESLAGMMRRLGYCEERGSGIDRALQEVERNALQAPVFAISGNSTVVTLFARSAFAAMTKEDRIRACYQHASLRFEAGDTMSNASLRRRFGLPQKQYPQVSEVISDARAAGLIVPFDENQGNRNAKYLPWWADDYVSGSRRPAGHAEPPTQNSQ